MKTMAPELCDRQSRLLKTDFQKKSQGISFEDNRISSIQQAKLVQKMSDNSPCSKGSVLQRAAHVKATCSITTADKGKIDATVTSQDQYEASRSRVLREMNEGVSPLGNPLYQCAEPKSLYRIISYNNLEPDNLTCEELKTIKWSNVHWYYDADDTSKPNDGKKAEYCLTCQQWIDKNTDKPKADAISRVKVKFETNAERRAEKEAEREEQERLREEQERLQAEALKQDKRDRGSKINALMGVIEEYVFFCNSENEDFAQCESLTTAIDEDCDFNALRRELIKSEKLDEILGYYTGELSLLKLKYPEDEEEIMK